MAGSAYVLGTHEAELERLRFQHQLWLPMAQEAWERAGLKAGERVLDLGSGPGFAAIDLAQRVGPGGRVLALEQSGAYVQAGREMAERRGLLQLELRQHNLLHDPLPLERFDLIWCRWVAMFLADLNALLDPLPNLLAPGGRLLIHEYVHWDSFGLHPHGEAIDRFGKAVQASFLEAGGDPNVNRRLPSLLAARGLRIGNLHPLPVVGVAGSMAARWMEHFVGTYGQQLQRLGLWSSTDAAAAASEIDQAHLDPGSYWVGPTLLELQATRWEP
jgi:SAM-dependent methyltransferase